MAQPISFPLLYSSSIILPSPTLSSTTIFFILSVHFICSISFHIHILNASSHFCSFHRSVQISAPYNATLHTKHFNSLFLSSFSKGPQKMLLFLLKASFAITILCFTYWQQFMLLLIPILTLTIFIYLTTKSKVRDRRRPQTNEYGFYVPSSSVFWPKAGPSLQAEKPRLKFWWRQSSTTNSGTEAAVLLWIY